MKKGLSSSAAVTVLVARAFNRVYDIKLTVRGEMELTRVQQLPARAEGGDPRDLWGTWVESCKSEGGFCCFDLTFPSL